MSAQPDSFYVAVLRGIRAPVNDANLFLCHAWQHMEGAYARYNPWNTTEQWPRSTNYRKTPPYVKNYASAKDGEDATVATLLNGRYGHIIDGFHLSEPLRTAEAIDASPWGTHGVTGYVRAHWHGGTHHPYPGHLIKQGSTDHTSVRLVQRRVGTADDGIFGPHTYAAVVSWQHRHGLSADGVVGPLTWRAMFG